MRHLIVVLKLLLNKHNREKGVTLLEVVLVSVIVGIMAAMSVPNTLEQQNRQKVNETFSRIRGALTEAQVNANRLSRDCTVQISSTRIGGKINQTTGIREEPGCVLEDFAVNTSIVSIKQGDDFTTATSVSTTKDVVFEFDGRTGTAGTLWIARTNDTTGNTAKCIVISPLGMIRTGIYKAPASPTNDDCHNVENERYTP